MRSLFRACGVLLATGLLAVAVCGQTALTNDAIVKMVKAGLAEDVIVNMINSQPAQFSVTPDAMIALKKDGVSDKLISAMLSKGSSAAAPSAAPSAAVAPATDATANLEQGIYFKKSNDWVEVLPEVVNWKTGGMLKGIATGGLVKGDVNGNIKNPQSKNKVTTPLEFLIKAPEGVAITEYQLIRLRSNKSEREFR